MSIKILLADDSITIQKVVGIIFGGEDYSLTVVDNGKSAVEKAREIDPDVLLIDALMPGMSGYEVCEAIRSTSALSTKPILLLTGSFEPFDENKAKTCGADDFIAKPFESQQIVTKVKELFELGKGRISAALNTPASPAAADPFSASAINFSSPSTIVAPIATPIFETAKITPASFAVPPVIPVQQIQPARPVIEPIIEQFSPFESTSFTPEPAVALAPVTASAEITAPAIWDAFTPVEPTAVQIPESTPFPMPNDDVFAMIQEEPEITPVQQFVAPTEQHQHIDSQWVPVEEQTFEFTEEKIAELPNDIFDTPLQAVEPVAFGDISFEEPLAPVIEKIVPPAPELPPSIEAIKTIDNIVATKTATIIETVVSTKPIAIETQVETISPEICIQTSEQTIAVPATLTEEQLKIALSSVSKEIIERIVWEVVPDLAELLIKEAIKKIKDGL